MKRMIGIALALLLGSTLTNTFADNTISKNKEGETIINTTTIGKNIRGYGGATPLLLTIKNGKVKNVTLLPNNESPNFLNRVVSGKLLLKWNGMKLKDARKAQIDGVTGATYTSKSVIQNVNKALDYAIEHKVK